MTNHQPTVDQVWVYARVEEVHVEGGQVEAGQVLLDCIQVDSPTLLQLIGESHKDLKLRWRRSFRLNDDSAAPSMDVLSETRTAMVTVRVVGETRWQEWMADATWLRLQVPATAFNSEQSLVFAATDLETVPPKEANKLSAILDMMYWPRIPAPQLRAVLDEIPSIQGSVVHDVGQGSANALIDEAGKAVMYFDVGRGGKGTSAPINLELCYCDTPLVILSHWDRDHWAAAQDGTQKLLKSRWVVPSQKIAGTHAKFAALILRQGGSICVVKRSSKPKKNAPIGQGVYVKYGKGADRNNSGLALTLTCYRSCSSHTMYFPGDARYNMCEDPPRIVALLVASHHGADPQGASNLPKPSPDPWARLVYSFGCNNRYNHPFDKALKFHKAQGWDHLGWNDSRWNASTNVGSVRATYASSDNKRQSILFPAHNMSLGAHFRESHGETLLS